MKKVIIVLLVLLCYISGNLFSAFKDAGWGARSVALGGAFAAVSDDPTGILYNPAGIAQIRNFEMNMMYGELYRGLEAVDLKTGYASMVLPFGKNADIGIQWANFVSKAQYGEDTISINYACRLNGFLRMIFNTETEKDTFFGFNLKYLNHYYVLDERTVIDPVFSGGIREKSNFTIDIGMLHRIIQNEKSDLSFAFSAKNINQPDVGLKSIDLVPLEGRLGLAYKIRLNSFISNLLTAFDVSYRNQNWGSSGDRINIHFGQEISFWRKVFSLRVGGNYNEISCGLGFMTPNEKGLNLQLDYAFLLPLQIKESDGSHRLSLTFRFK